MAVLIALYNWYCNKDMNDSYRPHLAFATGVLNACSVRYNIVLIPTVVRAGSHLLLDLAGAPYRSCLLFLNAGLPCTPERVFDQAVISFCMI